MTLREELEGIVEIRDDIEAGMDGDSYYARRFDFQNLQESCCGFGNSESEAVIDLIKQEHIDDIDAIEKLIEKRENELYLKWMKNMFKMDYITRKEAYEKVVEVANNYGGINWFVKEQLRNAFGIPEGKE